MKLNQYHKQAIVRAIEHDLPKWDEEGVSKKIKDALYKAMSKECRAAYRKAPHSIRTERIHYCGLNQYSLSILPTGDANVKEVLAPFKSEWAKRQSAITQLKAAVEACSTRKQFIDRFPEFSNYAPAEEGKCPTLPAIANVVAGLIEIGFIPKVTQ